MLQVIQIEHQKNQQQGCFEEKEKPLRHPQKQIGYRLYQSLLQIKNQTS